jgi:hypothetical protein
MSEENKCNCSLCELSVERTKALESDDIEFIKKTLEKFADLWLCADFDRSYYMCILDGSWQDGDEILKLSLEKYRRHPNRGLEHAT